MRTVPDLIRIPEALFTGHRFVLTRDEAIEPPTKALQPEDYLPEDAPGIPGTWRTMSNVPAPCGPQSGIHPKPTAPRGRARRLRAWRTGSALLMLRP